MERGTMKEEYTPRGTMKEEYTPRPRRSYGNSNSYPRKHRIFVPKDLSRLSVPELSNLKLGLTAEMKTIQEQIDRHSDGDPDWHDRASRALEIKKSQLETIKLLLNETQPNGGMGGSIFFKCFHDAVKDLFEEEEYQEVLVRAMEIYNNQFGGTGTSTGTGTGTG
jgi:hypothetical protein